MLVISSRFTLTVGISPPVKQDEQPALPGQRAQRVGEPVPPTGPTMTFTPLPWVSQRTSSGTRQPPRCRAPAALANSPFSSVDTTAIAGAMRRRWQAAVPIPAAPWTKRVSPFLSCARRVTQCIVR